MWPSESKPMPNSISKRDNQDTLVFKPFHCFFFFFYEYLWWKLRICKYFFAPLPVSDVEGGIIDRVAQDVFLLLEEKRNNSDGVDATVRVSYMELYREELRDLLELHTVHKELHIREDERGNTGHTMWQKCVFILSHANCILTFSYSILRCTWLLHFPSCSSEGAFYTLYERGWGIHSNVMR